MSRNLIAMAGAALLCCLIASCKPSSGGVGTTVGPSPVAAANKQWTNPNNKSSLKLISDTQAEISLGPPDIFLAAYTVDGKGYRVVATIEGSQKVLYFEPGEREGALRIRGTKELFLTAEALQRTGELVAKAGADSKALHLYEVLQDNEKTLYEITGTAVKVTGNDAGKPHVIPYQKVSGILLLHGNPTEHMAPTLVVTHSDGNHNFGKTCRFPSLAQMQKFAVELDAQVTRWRDEYAAPLANLGKAPSKYEGIVPPKPGSQYIEGTSVFSANDFSRETLKVLENTAAKIIFTIPADRYAPPLIPELGQPLTKLATHAYEIDLAAKTGQSSRADGIKRTLIVEDMLEQPWGKVVLGKWWDTKADVADKHPPEGSKTEKFSLFLAPAAQ